MIEHNAHISDCGLYRYTLRRKIRYDTGLFLQAYNFKMEKDLVAFVMLNPSTADAEKDDPTIRRCIDYAQQWGYNELLVLNIFAYRSTDPRKLKSVNDPVGPLNHETFKRKLLDVGEVICAWGNHGSIKVDGAPTQSDWALGWIEATGHDPMALRKMAKSGQPAHSFVRTGDLYQKNLPEPNGFTECSLLGQFRHNMTFKC